MSKASLNTRSMGTARYCLLRGGGPHRRLCLSLLPLVFFIVNCEKHEETIRSGPPDEAVPRTTEQSANTIPFYEDFSRPPHDMATELKSEPAPLADEECCSNPGAIAKCWWQDARRDGAACENDSECSSGNLCDKTVKIGPSGSERPPNGWGLCECDEDKDCGVDENGKPTAVCTLDGRCGPSFCNGFLVCSCWGGCQEANTGGYPDHNAMCQATDDGYPGNCCEGKYPGDVDGNTLGFCSNFCVGAGGTICETDVDCNDANPCTKDSCDNTNRCFYDPISWGPPSIANLCAPPLGARSTDCVREWCRAGKCIWRPDNTEERCLETPVGIDTSWYGGEDNLIRIDDDDQTSCIYGTCNDQGQCEADPPAADGLLCDWNDDNPCTDSICDDGLCVSDVGDTRETHENQVCDGDGNACLFEKCLSGVCTFMDVDPCNDDNFCTGPDDCDDNDPNHLEPTCNNPFRPEGSNAETYGYIDLDPCVDVICRSGTEEPEAFVCTPPAKMHLSCNRYECDPDGEEDNCTTWHINENQPCDDGNGCTLNEVCTEGLCGNDETERKVCEDNNICTKGTCINDEAGTCRYDGAPKNDLPCNDNDKCTGEEGVTDNDVCSNGICTAGDDRDCTAGIYNRTCHEGACDATTGSCYAQIQEGDSCDDENPCTVADTCDATGACVGTKKTCPNDKPCHVGVCDTATGECGYEPVADGTSCEATDGTGECSPDDTCRDGVCQPDLANLITCENDVCNTRYCDPADGLCKFSNGANLNADCEGVIDNDPCTLDQCTGVDESSELTCTNVKQNDISSWYDPDSIVGTLTIDGVPANALTLTDAVLGEAKGYLLTEDTSGDSNLYHGEASGSLGWGGPDHIWEINYTGDSPATLHFSGCRYGGGGREDGQMQLFDCSRSSIAENNDSCRPGGMPEFSVTLDPDGVYFFLMDGEEAKDVGPYSIAIYYDTCSDGVLNGDEILVDSGGAACCSNGVRNGNEDAPDRGGSCCNDGILNGDETSIDCGGAYCDPCDPCTNGVLDDGELEIDCGGICPANCTTNADCAAGHVCNTNIDACGICVPLICSGASDTHLSDLGHFDQIELPMSEGCADVFVGDQSDLDYVHHGDRYLKFQIGDKAGSSGSCDFTSPNYSYIYTTEYCLTWYGTANIPYDDPSSSNDFLGCTQWGHTTGAGRIEKLYYELLVPVKQYTRRVRLGFIDNGDNCVLKSTIYWQ